MSPLTPRDTDFVDTAANRVTTVTTVNGTPQEVWAVLADNERWPEWFAAAKDCRTTSDRAGGVGSTRWIHVDLFKVNERFIAWDPPHRWAFTVLDANLPGIVSVVEEARLEAIGDDQTRVTYVMAADVAPYLRPLVPLLRRRLGRMFEKGLAGIETQVARLRAEATTSSATPT
jgi:uncharacterized protein YndB with AHSA1/START domain